MTYSANAVANTILILAGARGLNDVSPMKLQRLLYLVQGQHLKAYGTPLHDDHFARWEHGPVVASIFHKFRDFGVRPITQRLTVTGSRGGRLVPQIQDDDASALELVQSVLKRFGMLSGVDLSQRLRGEGSAWSLRGGDG